MIVLVRSLVYLSTSLIFSRLTSFGWIVTFSLSMFFLISLRGIPFYSLRIVSSLLGSLIDEYILVLNLILFLVVLVSYIAYKLKNSSSFYIDNLSILSFEFLIIASLIVFRRNSLFWIYFGYEMSLVPIIVIIIVWGVYPERMYRGIVMFLYTVFFSFPLISVILYIYSSNMSLILPLTGSIFINIDVGIIFGLVVFCSFAVKLPIYGIHYWLPLAHVEAPTFGRMLLAGVLLKLGGLSLYRFLTYYNFGNSLHFLVLSLLFLGIVIASLVCCIQSDIKRLIAYSSVVHITSVGVGLLTCLILGFKRGLIIIVIHGISSPLIFYMVGEVYDLLRTRLIVLIRGLYYLSPVIFWSMILIFFLTTPVPPIFSFLGEIILFTSLLSISTKVCSLIFLYVFFAVVFNLYWISRSFGKLRITVINNVSLASCWLLIKYSILGFLLVFLSFLF